jgi:hypothetical protein
MLLLQSLSLSRCTNFLLLGSAKTATEITSSTPELILPMKGELNAQQHRKFHPRPHDLNEKSDLGIVGVKLSFIGSARSNALASWTSSSNLKRHQGK